MNVRRFGRALGRFLFGAGLIMAAFFLFAPRELADLTPGFDPASLPEGAPGSLDDWLATREAKYPDIVPGTEKRIVWAAGPGQPTKIALVYLHGFSATSEEIRPVPDIVAHNLGANLYYTRLTGHGRGSAAMGEATVADWVNDLAEAVAIGGWLGEKVYLIGTSTGGTLAAIAANDPVLSPQIAGVVMISPNFDQNIPHTQLLTWPLARYWVPLVLGPERGFTPHNEGHGKFWTTRYASVAVVPMAALARAARGLDFFSVATAALVLYSPLDTVVKPQATQAVAASWAGPMVMQEITLGPGDDPDHHVIAGDILSPSQTAPIADLITRWIGSH